MHVFFSGIGGAGMSPLAMIAHEAGYEVSGSDKQDSAYLKYLRSHGIKDVYVGQSEESIAALHKRKPIDWLVYTSAVTLENPDAPEIAFCNEKSIRVSKRDQLLNQILKDKKLKLIAIAGTHGKTTTTAMVVWLFKELGLPLSYLIPAKTSYADLGKYDPKSKYFVYEADEFDRNFLAYEPEIALISGVSWDHHEIFPTREEYKAAFRDFISQSKDTFIWQDDADYLSLNENVVGLNILDPGNVKGISLLGKYNRLDAWLALEAVVKLSGAPKDELISTINQFPGLSRRMEKIRDNLYSDYAHTPEKIRGAMSVAGEMAAANGQKLIVVYEPLTNRRQYYMLDSYKDCFTGAEKVYWLPSYLAREDPGIRTITPEELISHLPNPEVGKPMKRSLELKKTIEGHLRNGDLVVTMAGGGGNSLDDWLRVEFKARSTE